MQGDFVVLKVVVVDVFEHQGWPNPCRWRVVVEADFVALTVAILVGVAGVFAHQLPTIHYYQDYHHLEST